MEESTHHVAKQYITVTYSGWLFFTGDIQKGFGGMSKVIIKMNLDMGVGILTQTQSLSGRQPTLKIQQLCLGYLWPMGT